MSLNPALILGLWFVSQTLPSISYLPAKTCLIWVKQQSDPVLGLEKNSNIARRKSNQIVQKPFQI
jgi:hypothetical protein